MNSSLPPSNNEPASPPDEPRIDSGKRVVALVIDVATAYVLGILVSFIPFIGYFLPQQAVMVIFLLTRDFLFDGRGVGKNMMGLRVIDVRTHQGPTILQAVQRNIIFFAPFVVLYAMTILMRFVPFEWLNKALLDLIQLVGMVYVAIVIPLEGWRVWQRPDGQRIGDEIAGTELVEANMDFSRAVR